MIRARVRIVDSGVTGHWPVVDHPDQSDGRTLRYELTRHLERDEAAEGEAEKIVRSARPELLDLLEIVLSHVFHPSQSYRIGEEGLRSYPINRLVRREMAHQRLELGDFAIDPMDEE